MIKCYLAMNNFLLKYCLTTYNVLLKCSLQWEICFLNRIKYNKKIHKIITEFHAICLLLRLRQKYIGKNFCQYSMVNS